MRFDRCAMGIGAVMLLGGGLVTTAAPAGATYSWPANADIVFSSNYTTTGCIAPCRNFTASHPTGGGPTLWLVNPIGINTSNDNATSDPAKATQLTDATGNDEYPYWSPSGIEVTFDRANSGSPQIYEVASTNMPVAEDVSTTDTPGVPAADGAVRLTADASSDQFPSFAPDNKTIVFVQDGANLVTIDSSLPAPAVENVLTFPAVGSLPGSGGGALSHPEFDPGDASKVLFLNNGHIELLTGVGVGPVSAFDVSALLSANVGVSGSGTDEFPDWSPVSGASGGAIAFDSTRGVTGSGTNTNQLWTISLTISGGVPAVTGSPVFVNASNAATLSGNKDTQPVWSPDGTQLAWTRQLANSDIEDEMFKLGSGNHVLTTATPIDLTAVGGNPPDNEPNWTGTTSSAVLPEAPYAVLLPGGSLLLLGLAFGLRRRRHRGLSVA